MARTFDKQFGDVKMIQTGRNTFVMFVSWKLQSVNDVYDYFFYLALFRSPYPM